MNLFRFEIIPQANKIEIRPYENDCVLLRASEYCAAHTSNEKLEPLSRFSLEGSALNALKHLPHLGDN